MKNFPSCKMLEYAVAVETVTTSKKDNLILNVDGCIAVSFVDLLRNCGAFSTEEAEDYLKVWIILLLCLQLYTNELNRWECSTVCSSLVVLLVLLPIIWTKRDCELVCTVIHGMISHIWALEMMVRLLAAPIVSWLASKRTRLMFQKTIDVQKDKRKLT